jgi:hypothetical protein
MPASRFALAATLAAACAGVTWAECPNLCSGHGSCDANDQCICFEEGKVLNKEGNEDEDLLFAQWTGADCSMMSCPRGVSWTTVNGATTHEMSTECSDAGICDRDVGQCECFEKYTGSACQRTKCLDGCSGHGVCTSNKDLAKQYAQQMSTNINLRQRMPRCDGSPSKETCSRGVEQLDAYYETYMVRALRCVVGLLMMLGNPDALPLSLAPWLLRDVENDVAARTHQERTMRVSGRLLVFTARRPLMTVRGIRDSITGACATWGSLATTAPGGSAPPTSTLLTAAALLPWSTRRSWA